MGLPSWRELIEKSADYFSISDEKKECICKCLDRNEYLDATDVILKAGVSDQMLREYIAKSMTEAKENSNSVDNNYLDLALFSKIRYMTTNYDQYMGMWPDNGWMPWMPPSGVCWAAVMGIRRVII